MGFWDDKVDNPIDSMFETLTEMASLIQQKKPWNWIF